MSLTKEYNPIINTGLQLEYEDFIRERGPFDTSMTITFRYDYSLDSANKKVRHFLKHINDGNTDFYKKFLFGWMFFDKNYHDKNLHIHLLLRGIDPLQYPLLERKCLKKFGFAEIKSVHDNSIPYLAQKYGTFHLIEDKPICIHSRRRNRVINLNHKTENILPVSNFMDFLLNHNRLNYVLNGIEDPST